MLDKVPPQNADYERAILGALMLPDENSDVIPIAMQTLVKDDFYLQAHKDIYEAVITLFEKDINVDLLTVTKELESKNRLKRAGGVPELNTMIDSVPSAANVQYYADEVKELALKRHLIVASAKIYHQAFDDSLDFEQMIGDAEKAICDIRAGRVEGRASSIRDVFKSTIDRLNLIADNPDGLLGIATGFHDLDSCIQGIQKGALTTIAGRPGMGKSIVAEQIATHAAMHCEETVCFFSLEMPCEVLGMRIVSSISGLPFGRIRRARLSDAEWSKVAGVFSEMDSVPLYIDDTPGITVEVIGTVCRQIMRQYGLGVVVVDYFQLVERRSKEENRLAELEAISQAMQRLARTLDVAVVLVAQLNRNVESRPEKRPILSDIKSCGKLEEDSDVVIGIYRDAYYTKNEDDHSAELIVLKQRNGPLDTVKLRFDGARVRFVNV